MDDFEHYYKRIVIGGNFAATKFAYENRLPLLYKESLSPYIFETEKMNIYREMRFQLSLNGLVPHPSGVTNIVIDGNNLRVVCDRSRQLKYKIKKAIVFIPDELSILPAPKKIITPEYEVLDWFDVRTGMCHEHEHIASDENFIKDIYFYPSNRIDGEHNRKDLVAVSRLTEEQLHDIDYSEIYAKFKIISMMKATGISGPKNGTNAQQNPRYRPLKIESRDRTYRKLTFSEYENTKTMIFMKNENR